MLYEAPKKIIEYSFQELCDGFLDYLWKYVQNPNIQAVYRQTAVTYIGSLLARGKFVCIR